VEGVGLGDVPQKFLGRAGPERILQHREPEVEPRAKATDRLAAAVAQVTFEDVLQLVEPNPPPPEVIAIAILGPVGLTAEDLPSLFHSLVEGKVFKGMQGVVVDEDGDRPLRREQMRGVLDRLVDAVQVGFVGRGEIRGAYPRADRCGLHGAMAHRKVNRDQA